MRTPQTHPSELHLFRAYVQYTGPRIDVMPTEENALWAYHELPVNFDRVVLSGRIRLDAAKSLGVPVEELTVSELQSDGELCAAYGMTCPAWNWFLVRVAPVDDGVDVITPPLTLMLMESSKTADYVRWAHTHMMQAIVRSEVGWRAAVIYGVTPWLVFVPQVPDAEADVVAAGLPTLLAEAWDVAADELYVKAVQSLIEVRRDSPDTVRGAAIGWAWEAFEPPHDLWPDEQTSYCLLKPSLADYMSAVRKQMDADAAKAGV